MRSLSPIKFTSVIRAHPALVSGIYIAETMVDYPSDPTWIAAAITFLAVFFTSLWTYAAVELTAHASPDGNRRKVISRLAATALALSGALMAAGLLLECEGLADSHGVSSFGVGIVLVGSYLTLSWQAANLLARAERSSGLTSSTYGNLFLFLFLVVGVWFLRPRLLRCDKG